MNITAWDIYWITRLDSINAVSIAIMVIVGVITVVMLVIAFAEEEERLKKPIIAGICLFIASLTVCVFVPTTKEMIVIKGLPALLDSSLVQKEIPAEAAELYKIAKDYVKGKLLDKSSTEKEK